MGVPVISAWSLAKAIRLPAKETEPITMLKTLGKTSAKGGCELCSRSSETATRAAAPPPTPLKRATICGMAVILTRRAPRAPMGIPIKRPISVITMPASVKCSSGIVASNAIAMPTAAIWLPRRALRGELS